MGAECPQFMTRTVADMSSSWRKKKKKKRRRRRRSRSRSRSKSRSRRFKSIAPLTHILDFALTRV